MVAGGKAGIGVSEAFGDIKVPPKIAYDGEGGVADGLNTPEQGIASVLDKKIVPNFGESGGITNTDQFKQTAVAYKPDQTKRDTLVKEAKDLFNPMAEINVDKKGEDARGKALDYYGYTDDEMDLLNKLMADKEALYSGIMDPEKLRKQRVRAGILGGANTVGFGGLGAGISTGIASELAGQEKSAIGKLIDKQSDVKSLINKSRDIRQTAYGSGEKAEKLASDEKLKGIAELAGLNRQQQKDVTADAANMLAANTANMNANQKAIIESAKISVQKADVGVRAQVANLNAVIAKEKNAIQREFNKITATGQDKKAAQQAYTQTEKIIASTRAQLIKIYADQAKNLTIQDEVQRKAEITRINKERDLQVKIATESAIQMRNQFISQTGGGGKSTNLTTKSL